MFVCYLRCNFCRILHRSLCADADTDDFADIGTMDSCSLRRVTLDASVPWTIYMVLCVDISASVCERTRKEMRNKIIWELTFFFRFQSKSARDDDVASRNQNLHFVANTQIDTCSPTNHFWVVHVWLNSWPNCVDIDNARFVRWHSFRATISVSTCNLGNICSEDWEEIGWRNRNAK